MHSQHIVCFRMHAARSLESKSLDSEAVVVMQIPRWLVSGDPREHHFNTSGRVLGAIVGRSMYRRTSPGIMTASSVL